MLSFEVAWIHLMQDQLNALATELRASLDPSLLWNGMSDSQIMARYDLVYELPNVRFEGAHQIAAPTLPQDPGTIKVVINDHPIGSVPQDLT